MSLIHPWPPWIFGSNWTDKGRREMSQGISVTFGDHSIGHVTSEEMVQSSIFTLTKKNLYDHIENIIYVKIFKLIFIII